MAHRGEDLYEQHAQGVYRYLFSLGADADTAEDLTQETFCQALKSLDTFRGDCSPQTWLCAIAKRLWYKELERRKRFAPLTEDAPAPDCPVRETEEREQRLALYRSEVLQLLNTGRTVPFSAPASALSNAAQTRAEELQQTGKLSHKRPNGEDYTSLLPGSNLPGFVSKELYASGQATPAEFVSHLKTRRSGVDWETVLDTQYTQIGIGYAVDADGVPYWELLLLNG